MDAKLWIAFGFAVVTVIFFMIAYFAPPRSGNAAILRFLFSFSAGIAAGLFTGSLAISITGELSTAAQWTVSGAGGLGLFVLVWLTYPKAVEHTPGIRMSFPTGTTFEMAASHVGQAARVAVVLGNFTPAEKGSALAQLDLDERTISKALEALSAMVPVGAVRPYKVKPIAGGHLLEV